MLRPVVEGISELSEGVLLGERYLLARRLDIFSVGAERVAGVEYEYWTAVDVTSETEVWIQFASSGGVHAGGAALAGAVAALRRINHPAVPVLFAFGEYEFEHEGAVASVGYCAIPAAPDGETLAAALLREELDQAEILAALAQVAEVLELLAEFELVHGHLSAHSVLLTAIEGTGYEVVLADLPASLALETTLESDLSAAADVYALAWLTVLALIGPALLEAEFGAGFAVTAELELLAEDVVEHRRGWAAENLVMLGVSETLAEVLLLALGEAAGRPRAAVLTAALRAEWMALATSEVAEDDVVVADVAVAGAAVVAAEELVADEVVAEDVAVEEAVAAEIVAEEVVAEEGVAAEVAGAAAGAVIAAGAVEAAETKGKKKSGSRAAKGAVVAGVVGGVVAGEIVEAGAAEAATGAVGSAGGAAGAGAASAAAGAGSETALLAEAVGVMGAGAAGAVAAGAARGGAGAVTETIPKVPRSGGAKVGAGAGTAAGAGYGVSNSGGIGAGSGGSGAGHKPRPRPKPGVLIGAGVGLAVVIALIVVFSGNSSNKSNTASAGTIATHTPGSSKTGASQGATSGAGAGSSSSAGATSGAGSSTASGSATSGSGSSTSGAGSSTATGSSATFPSTLVTVPASQGQAVQQIQSVVSQAQGELTSTQQGQLTQILSTLSNAVSSGQSISTGMTEFWALLHSNELPSSLNTYLTQYALYLSASQGS